jgi:hypothetical protein
MGRQSLLEQGPAIGYRFVHQRCCRQQQRPMRHWHKTQKYHIAVRAGSRGGHGFGDFAKPSRRGIRVRAPQWIVLSLAITIANSLRANHF